MYTEKRSFIYRCLNISWRVGGGTPVLVLKSKPQAKTDPIGTVLSEPWSVQCPLVKFHQWTWSLLWRMLMILHIQKSWVSSSASAQTATHWPGAKLKRWTWGVVCVWTTLTLVWRWNNGPSRRGLVMGWAVSPSKIKLLQVGWELETRASCASKISAHSLSSDSRNSGAWQLSANSVSTSGGNCWGRIVKGAPDVVCVSCDIFW